MSIGVANDHGELSTNRGSFWCLMLNLAEYYGWKPMGTRKPEDYGLFRRWPSNYDTNDGQTVVKWDAHRLGEIIAHLLTDPNFDDNVSVFMAEMKEQVQERVGPDLFRYPLTRMRTESLESSAREAHFESISILV